MGFFIASMYKLLKPLFFSMSPERAHYLTFDLLKTACAMPGMKMALQAGFDISTVHDGVHLWGLDFKNRVGLAAGLDKDARWIDELANLGFGYLEVGTLTPKAQPGNPRPRLFRLVKDEAIINRMGFNNEGALAAARRLAARKRKDIIIGGNIGKNKVTPNEEAVNDYLACFEALKAYVDYFVVNVSSPNTPGLRELQEKGPLLEILNALQVRNHDQARPQPLLLKIAPDLTETQLDDIAEIAIEAGLSGVIATNTTISRSNLKTPEADVEKIGAGGLSGKPLTRHSTDVLNYLKQKSDNRFSLVGVGGIMGGEDARMKINAGADLVQVYTGLIYRGPAIVKEVVEALRKH